MSSKESLAIFQDISDINNKTKLFLNKLNHRRNLSTLTSTHQYKNKSPIKFPPKEEIKKRPHERSTSFVITSSLNSLEQISSYETNEKPKINKEKKESKKIINVAKDSDKNNNKENKVIEKKDKKKKKQKLKFPRTSIKNSPKNNEKEKENEKAEIHETKEIIVRENYDNSLSPENYIILPKKLNEELEKPELNLISPNKNVEGNYSRYINDVVKSLKEFIELDYDSIFDHQNKDNVKYVHYTSPMIIEEYEPRKKLLLIDLDETLIHTKFRNRDNYKELDILTKNSKCLNRTFSYSDENYIYYMDVFFRPHLKNFLTDVSKFFDLAIFTAGTKLYADTIIDYIDPENKFFLFRLYREACIPIQQRLYIKDLRIIKDYDPTNVILMDNSLYSFMNQPSNGMLVNSFFTNYKDTQLISARNFLINHIYPCEDIRKECEKWYHFTNLFYKGTSKEVKEN